MRRRGAEETPVGSRRTTWGAPSLLGQALASAGEGGPHSEGPSSRRVVSRRGLSRSRSRERGSGVFRRKRETEGAPWVSPSSAAHRHVKAWLGESQGASKWGAPRDFRESTRGSSSRAPIDGDQREELWAHDLWEGGEGEVGSSVFVRNLPTDITHQEVTSNFSKCGKVVAVKVNN